MQESFVVLVFLKEMQYTLMREDARRYFITLCIV